MVKWGVELPYLPDWKAQDQDIAGDVQTAPRQIECYLIDAVSVLSIGPEARDGVALDHEDDKDGDAAGEDDGSDHSNDPSKVAHDEDAPVEEKDPDLDDCSSESLGHHEDVEVLNYLAGKC